MTKVSKPGTLDSYIPTQPIHAPPLIFQSLTRHLTHRNFQYSYILNPT